MTELQPPKKDDGGGGGWIMTFADLMSLLMCFFVLLLSFAELDVMKFKAIAGSMKLAFGVQREIKAIEVPKGTSIVAQEYSSASPEPTLINEVRQQTTDEDKQSLEFTDALVDEPDGTNPEDSEGGVGADQRAEQQAEFDAEQLAEALRQEIDGGMIEIETEGATILIRIREKGSFPSGAARFDPAFAPVIDKLRLSLHEIEGTIAVAGHTDNIPIRTQLYRSNWDLSSARAVSVVHALLADGVIDAGRFVVEGHGEAHPLAANDTRENRARNRRVEITIRQLGESVDKPPHAEADEQLAGAESAPSTPIAPTAAATVAPAVVAATSGALPNAVPAAAVAPRASSLPAPVAIVVAPRASSLPAPVAIAVAPRASSLPAPVAIAVVPRASSLPGPVAIAVVPRASSLPAPAAIAVTPRASSLPAPAAAAVAPRSVPKSQTVAKPVTTDLAPRAAVFPQRLPGGRP